MVVSYTPIFLGVGHATCFVSFRGRERPCTIDRPRFTREGFFQGGPLQLRLVKGARYPHPHMSGMCSTHVGPTKVKKLVRVWVSHHLGDFQVNGRSTFFGGFPNNTFPRHFPIFPFSTRSIPFANSRTTPFVSRGGPPIFPCQVSGQHIARRYPRDFRGAVPKGCISPLPFCGSNCGTHNFPCRFNHFRANSPTCPPPPRSTHPSHLCSHEGSSKQPTDEYNRCLPSQVQIFPV